MKVKNLLTPSKKLYKKGPKVIKITTLKKPLI